MREKNESGMVMIEATYCILISIIVAIMLISFSFLAYQKTMFSIAVNDVAENVAQTYKYRNIKNNQNIQKQDIKGVGVYRYWFNAQKFAYASNTKAATLTENMLRNGSLAYKKSSNGVKVRRVVDDIGRSHLEVTVRYTYSFFLGNVLNLIGQNGTQTFEKTVYVESVDVASYINTVKITKYAIDKAGHAIDQIIKITPIIKNSIQIIRNLQDLID